MEAAEAAEEAQEQAFEALQEAVEAEAVAEAEAAALEAEIAAVEEAEAEGEAEPVVEKSGDQVPPMEMDDAARVSLVVFGRLWSSLVFSHLDSLSISRSYSLVSVAKQAERRSRKRRQH